MWGQGVWGYFGIIILCTPTPLAAQHLVWNDSVNVMNLKNLADSGESIIRLRITQQLDYALTLSSLFFINWEHEQNVKQVMVLHDFVYQCHVDNTRKFRFTQKITHHLGGQYFFDSIFRFHVDDNILETRLEWKLRKNHGIFLSSIISTRLFNRYDFSLNDSGNLVKKINSSFLTPMTGTFSGGFRFNWPRFGSLNFGLSSAKFTWIRDKQIYEAQKTNIYYGVTSDKKNLVEYGFSLQLQIDRDLVKWIHWNCDLLLFKNAAAPVDIIMRNLFTIRITRFLKTQFQTRIYYEEQISKKLQLENIVSVGFSVRL
ncbi:MAG: hypothetical protein ISR57_07435 [Bacteroidales bacterium]|nr:hypothetical protein [Bacteroidota bacterium]MBL6950461.1 hypothetical protein [Bacteroidales bacterium]